MADLFAGPYVPALGFYDRLGFRRLDVDDLGPVVYLGLAL